MLNRNEYMKEWRRKRPGYMSKKVAEWRKTPAGRISQIWVNLKSYKKKNRRRISKKDFEIWWNSQKRICVYCGIKEEFLSTDIFLQNHIGTRLQIDRKDSTKDYQKGNLALACRLCNQIKTNIFSESEMIIIGKMIRAKRKRSCLNSS